MLYIEYGFFFFFLYLFFLEGGVGVAWGDQSSPTQYLLQGKGRDVILFIR